MVRLLARRASWALWLAALGVLVPGAVRAQARTVAGSVRVDATSGVPAAGVVQLVDAAGRMVAVARPSASGTFALRAPAPGRYRLRLLRLGFAPVERALDVGASDLALGVLDGPSVPVALEAVRVEGAAACADARAEGRVGDTWRLFEVVLAAQVADQGATGAEERWLSYEQRVDPRTGIVQRITVRDDPGTASGGYRPLAAAALASDGFVTQDAQGFAYALPGAGTLLSPEFLDRYCFSPTGTSGPGGRTIALAFRPLRAVGGRTDVAGEMVFTPEAQRLEHVRFDYVNLPEVLGGARGSGRVRFSTREARTTVSAWWVDMPVVAGDRLGGAGAAALTTRLGRRTVVTERRRAGALRLESAPCPGCGAVPDTSTPGLVLSRPAAADDRSPLVTLRAAGATIPATAEGRVIPWPPGRYEVQWATAWMAALGVEQRTALEVTEGAPPTPLVVATLTRREVLQRACGAERDRGGRGSTGGEGGTAVGGVVRSAGGAPAAGASLVVRSAGPDGETDRVIAADSAGVWRLCLPAAERPSRVWAIGEGARAEAVLAAVAGPSVVDLALRGFDVTAGAPAAPSVLEVRVRTLTGEPVEGAEVWLDAARRTGERRRTDAQGLAVFLVADSGAVRLSARRIGVRPSSLVARVAPGRNAIGLVLSDAGGVRLDTVRVYGERRISSRLDGFETRAREKRPNRVLRADQLQRYTRLSEALLGVPGVIVMDSSGQKMARTFRTTSVTTQAGPPRGCPLRVIVDGVPQPAGVSLDFGPPAAQVHGVEVYLSVSRIPPEFGGTLGPGECGLLLVWTKDGSTPDP